MDYDYSYDTLNSSSADASGGLLAGIGVGFILVYLVFLVFALVTMWKLYAKAGKPGWAALVPIYNIVVLLQIIGRPAWWTVLYFVPFANLIVGIVNSNDLAKSFGKDVAWTLGLLFLPFIFYPILAFGSAKYVGPSVKSV